MTKKIDKKQNGKFFLTKEFELIDSGRIEMSPLRNPSS